MHVEDVVTANLVAHLANRLEERLAFDVANGAANLDDDDVGLRFLGERKHEALDGIGHVGHSLNRAAKVVAAALLGDDLAVDLASGDVGGPGQFEVNEALVMAKVKVRFAAVPRDEYFAVLVRRHGAGVEVQVRVELLDRDLQAPALQDPPDRRDADALPDRTDHATSDEHVLRFHRQPPGTAGVVVTLGARRNRRTNSAIGDGWAWAQEPRGGRCVGGRAEEGNTSRILGMLRKGCQGKVAGIRYYSVEPLSLSREDSRRNSSKARTASSGSGMSPSLDAPSPGSRVVSTAPTRLSHWASSRWT